MAVTGTFIGDFSSFQAAVDQSDVKIRQFESNSAKVETTLNRVANAFSGRKIIQEATLMAAAIEKGGGAATLTASELQRAGNVAAEAAEKMRALGIAVPENINKLAESAKGAGGFMEELLAHAKGTALGMITAEAAIETVSKGFELLTGFIEDSVEAAAKEELALKRVSTALKVQGETAPEVAESYKELAEQYEQTTTFSHTLLQETEALLIQVGDITPKQMNRALQAVTDLASGLGIDLHSATLLIGKAFEGNTTTLGRYGIVLDQARVKTEGITYVLDELERKFGGQASAEVETYAGKVKQMANEWERFKESIGKSVIQDETVIAFMKSLKEGIDGVSGSAKEGLPSITAFFAGMVSPQAELLIRLFQSAQHEVRTLDDEIKNMAPPPPKQFQGFTDDIDAADKKTKEFAANTAKAWVDYDKTLEASRAKHEKEEDEKNKKFEAEQGEFSKLLQENTKLQIEQSGNARDAQIANIREAERAEIESLQRRGIATKANMDLVHENADKAIKGLGIDWKMLSDQSLETARQQRDDALETYEYMLAHANNYTREALDKQLQKYRELAEAATAHGRAAVDAEDAATEATKRHNEELKKQKEKEDEAAAAAKKKKEAETFTTEITAANIDQFNPQGVNKSAMLELLKQGFSIANALAVLEAEKRGVNLDLSKWTPEARGPRVPGFRLGVERFAGGPAVVGEDGPEVVDLPAGARVTPLTGGSRRPLFDSLQRSSGPATVNVNVSGVFDPASRSSIEKVVSKELAAKVFGGRR